MTKKTKINKKLRDNTIYLLHTVTKLSYTEITNLKAHQFDDDFITVAIKRGKRLFKVALSKQLSVNMQLLCLGLDDNDRIFNLTRTSITKIINKSMGEPIEDIKNNNEVTDHKDPGYHVKRIYDKFVVCYDNKPLNNLSMKTLEHARTIANIMNLELNT